MDYGERSRSPSFLARPSPIAICEGGSTNAGNASLNPRDSGTGIYRKPLTMDTTDAQVVYCGTGLGGFLLFALLAKP
ncbi:MAG: hypothetical protein DME97_07540 [Verrucomicrobia bacterium]|nr:MAG: hypothetical protein DME97_07540 [Verrucomicrobiota bacterium]